jgi:hypothetical protein
MAKKETTHEVRMTQVDDLLHSALKENGAKEKRGPGAEALLFLEKNYPIKNKKSKTK